MGLPPGTRFGPYEIVAPLGTGGMGEVYRARDTDLKREVALKVLPAGVAGDTDRLARFRREAEVLAALNHPHIAQIHGLTTGPNGTPALVMELVEGPTLAEVVAAGPVATPRAVEIAVQIADGLEAAHDAGIVHRDLKPANIKLRADGVVKLLDFGLARSTSTPGPEATATPTLTSPAMTRAGVVLGTAAYMSPEQARGQVADVRSDIWAFGCVVFELLTGRRAFPGDTIADVVAAVLEREPDWSALPASARGRLDRVVRRCLARDRRGRYAAIADVRFDLVTTEGGDSATVAAPRHNAVGWSMAVVTAMALVAAAVGLLGRGQPEADGVPGDDVLTGAQVTADVGRLSFGHTRVTFAPDGRRLFYVAIGGDGREQVWVKPLDGSAGMPIPGTEGGSEPAVSRDGQWLAFTRDGKLAKVPVRGGRPQMLADTPHMHGATWSADGRAIYFAPNVAGAGIWRVPADGGEAVQVTKPDPDRGEVSHEWPAVSPDGTALLFVTDAQGRTLDDSHIVAVRLADGQRTTVVRNALAPRLGAANRIFYIDRNGDLVTDGFTAESHALEGAPAILAPRIWLVGGDAMYDVGLGGAVAFMPGNDYGQRRITLASATEEPFDVGAAHPFVSIAASPDGTQLAATTQDRTMLATDVARPRWTPIVTDAVIGPALWTTDGRGIVYGPRPGRLTTVSASGAAGATVATDAASDILYPLTWTRDGALLFRKLGESGVRRQPAVAGAVSESFPAFSGRFRMAHVAVSPDGDLIAYASDHSGRYEIYLRPFDSPDPTIQVSSGLASMEPHWTQDGAKLFFASGGSSVQAVSVSRHPLRVSEPRVERYVIDRIPSGGDRNTFAPLPGGRIAYIREGDRTARDHVVVRQDWRTLLTTGAPGLTNR